MYEFIIKALMKTIEANIPEVKTVDVWDSALDSISRGEKEGNTRPAIYIELGDLEVTDLVGKQCQVLSGSVEFHIVVDSMGGFNAKASNFERNIKAFKFVDSVYTKLMGLTDAKLNNLELSPYYSISNMIRTTVSFPSISGNIAEGIVGFDFVLSDNSLIELLEEGEVKAIETEVTVQ